jgi:hypothetical protein
LLLVLGLLLLLDSLKDALLFLGDPLANLLELPQTIFKTFLLLQHFILGLVVIPEKHHLVVNQRLKRHSLETGVVQVYQIVQQLSIALRVVEQSSLNTVPQVFGVLLRLPNSIL